MRDELFGELLGGVEQETAADAAIVFDGFQQLLLVLFAHARQFANLSFARQFFDSVEIADLVGAPDQRDRLRTEALNLEQFEHRRAIFFQQFGVDLDGALLEKMLQIGEHAFANAGHGEKLLGLVDQIGDLLRQRFNGLGGVAIGTNAEGVLAVDFEQVGSFVENSGDGFVVHGRRYCSAQCSRQLSVLVKSKPGHHGVHRGTRGRRLSTHFWELDAPRLETLWELD